MDYYKTKILNMKKIIFLIATILFCKNSQAQYPNPFLVGYWQNWNQVDAPFIPLTSIPAKYNVVNVAFATASDLKGQMVFSPTAPYTQASFIADINTIKAQGKKVLISIGGSVAHGGRINLTDVVDRDNFINSINNILNQYPFDGIDIDLEQDCLKFDQSGTLTDTKSPSIDNLIFAIKSIMQTYRTKNGKKMLLSLAPEQNHVSGSLGAHSYLVEPHSDAYLPVLEQLKDSIDAVFPQMYGINIIGPTTNDRTGIFGIDGILYFF
jgi:chitinase